MATHRPQEDAGPLGVPLSEHDRNSGRNHTFIVLLAVGGLIAVLAGPLMRSQGVNGGVCVSGFGLLLILLAGWSGYVAWRDRDLRVRVYEDGLVQRKGGTERTVLWEEVASVNRTAIQSRRAGVVVRTTNLCTLTIDGGETLQLSDVTLQDVSVLCATVQERALVPLLKTAAMKLQSGESFSFGKLSASKVGLDTGRATIPWAKIEAVRVDDGWVAVQVDGRWRNVATANRVSNVHVLAALVARDSSGTSNPIRASEP